MHLLKINLRDKTPNNEKSTKPGSVFPPCRPYPESYPALYLMSWMQMTCPISVSTNIRGLEQARVGHWELEILRWDSGGGIGEYYGGFARSTLQLHPPPRILHRVSQQSPSLAYFRPIIFRHTHTYPKRQSAEVLKRKRFISWSD